MPRHSRVGRLEWPRCACGCGRYVPPERDCYASDACCHRAAQRRYRQRLASEWERIIAIATEHKRVGEDRHVA